ncbi:MAG: lipoprotein [Erysipelotrichaceae bacterium]|nr:lipoprotein [Erysipelotrichaceae bacterium]
MKKLISILIILLILTGCSSGEKKPDTKTNDKISFEAYVKEGETFTFEFDPSETISYEELRNNIQSIEISPENWRSYFDVKEVYREHYEYDDEGNPTATYMKGNVYMVVLLDDYYYVDNWSRNGLEYEIFVDGYETRVMTNEGKTYDPVTDVYKENRNYSGADPMIILSDFENSWDELTTEKYTGELNSYEMIDISNSNGPIKLVNSSAVNFKKYKDGIYYLVAYDSPDEYFVIFLKSDDNKIDREKEYDGAVYHTANDRYTGYTKVYPWAMVIELMKEVND